MVMVRKWHINCATDGVLYVWSDTEPTECPNDSGHSISEVWAPMEQQFIMIQRGAFDAGLHFKDSNGIVWRYTVDTNGDWVKTQITGV